MRILFDQGTPRPLRNFLTEHQVRTPSQLGWSELENGDLLAAAEGAFDLFITTDKNLRYQQNLRGRKLIILVLPLPDWNVVRLHTDKILATVTSAKPGEYIEITW